MDGSDGADEGRAKKDVVKPNPRVPQRLFKPFKPPATVSASRTQAVAKLQEKLLKTVDEIFLRPKDPEPRAKEEAGTVPKRKLEAEPRAPESVPKLDTNLVERKKPRIMEPSNASNGTRPEPTHVEEIVTSLDSGYVEL